MRSSSSRPFPISAGLSSRLAVMSLAALLFSAGCKRTVPPEPASRQSGTAASEAAAPPKPVEPVTLSAQLSRPAAPRVVAIGDLHGDLEATRRALRLAGAIDANDKWVGGDLVVVQTGDQIDRGDDDRTILDAFDRWRVQAKQAGGEMLALLGNHEVMNVMLDFRYVTPGAYPPFADVKAEVPFGADAAGQFPEKSRGRVQAFSPGGLYAKRLAERPVIARVGDTVFVHGGLLGKHITYGLDRLNDELHAFFNGKTGRPPQGVTGEDGLVWLRTYSQDPTPSECQALAETLARVAAKRLVVGHTVQKDGITEACGGMVQRIDVGLAKFYGGPISVLEIKGDKVTPLREPR
jgi:hypothetical protein